MLAKRRLELITAVLAVAFVWSWWFGPVLVQFLLGVTVTILGAVLATRWGRALLKQVIWRLRNRLMVAYLFIAVIPVLLGWREARGRARKRAPAACLAIQGGA